MKFIILLTAIFAGICANPLSIENNSTANGRIIGGTGLIDTLSAPFIAAVAHPNVDFLCSGIIVTLDKILTTADCVYAYSFEDPVQVYANVGGILLPNYPEPGRMSIVLKKIVIHPDFHSREMIYYHNVAVLRTRSSIMPTIYIAPIALPDAGTVITEGTNGNLVGWGGSSDSTPVRNLQLFTVNVVLTHNECQRLSGMVIDMEFCTDPAAGSGSACKYDHGSPLFENNAVYGNILIGMVNYAPCFASFPTIYTNIPDYVTWIISI